MNVARGRPFAPGVSGNPGGRPKGLARYVRELVGDDGRRIADFMLSVLDDEAERTETRMQAAAWLADRGFGKSPVTVDVESSSAESPPARPWGLVTLAELLDRQREVESDA